LPPLDVEPALPPDVDPPLEPPVAPELPPEVAPDDPDAALPPALELPFDVEVVLAPEPLELSPFLALIPQLASPSIVEPPTSVAAIAVNPNPRVNRATIMRLLPSQSRTTT
jgi:hypothetical protein